MFGALGLAVLSGLGRRYTHPGRWIHLPFRGFRFPLAEVVLSDATQSEATTAVVAVAVVPLRPPPSPQHDWRWWSPPRYAGMLLKYFGTRSTYQHEDALTFGSQDTSSPQWQAGIEEFSLPVTSPHVCALIDFIAHWPPFFARRMHDQGSNIMA
jgi:hypothetical protein